MATGKCFANESENLELMQDAGCVAIILIYSLSLYNSSEYFCGFFKIYRPKNFRSCRQEMEC